MRERRTRRIIITFTNDVTQYYRNGIETIIIVTRQGYGVYLQRRTVKIQSFWIAR